MNARIIVVLLFCAASLSAETSKVTKATGSIIRTKGKIQTGSSSRIELELPCLAIVRVGSNADFKYSQDGKTMSLAKGTMLLAVPERVDGISIESGATLTTLSKGDLEMSNINGQAKIIVLNGKVFSALAANPSDRRTMRAGDMIAVPAGATQMPKMEAIKLSKLLDSSILFNMGPLPTSRAIRQKATSQAPPRPFVTGGFDPDLLSIGPPGTAAMIARMNQGRVPLPPILAPGVIPTQTQIAEFEAAGAAVPRSNERALQQNNGRPATVPNQTPRPAMTPRPFPTRPPIVRPPGRPDQGLPIPRPTLRPPIAVP